MCKSAEGKSRDLNLAHSLVAIMFDGTELPFSDSHTGVMTKDRWSCFGTRSKLNDEPVFCLLSEGLSL